MNKESIQRLLCLFQSLRERRFYIEQSLCKAKKENANQQGKPRQKQGSRLIYYDFLEIFFPYARCVSADKKERRHVKLVDIVTNEARGRRSFNRMTQHNQNNANSLININP